MRTENLKISIIQPDIIWEDKTANLQKYSKMISQIEETDLVILPEMFTTGFSMNLDKLKETMQGESVKWMKELAIRKDASVIGSLIIEEGEKVYNRAIWVFPNGTTSIYDKRHLFTMGKEHLYYKAGDNKTVIDYKGWKFCPFICYDLRFPVWNRNDVDYDVLFFMANWPSARQHHWKNLLISRAIENQSYCFGINRVGVDGTGLTYIGYSGLISPGGVVEFMGEKESIQTFEISYSELLKYRKDFPFLNDRDEFKIQ